MRRGFRRPAIFALAVLVVGGGLLLAGERSAPILRDLLSPVSHGASVPDPRSMCEDRALGAEATTAAASAVPEVWLDAGADIYGILAATGEGAVIGFRAGTYSGLMIRPKRGQTFVAEVGTLFDGAGAPYAFRSHDPDVTISGFELVGYAPEFKQGVIHADDGANNWRILGNHVHSNRETGIFVQRGAEVAGNSIHHNGRYGIDGRGSGLVVRDNVITCNAVEVGRSDDSGGTKFVFTTGLLLEGNHVEANIGNGLWIDINNSDSTVRNNVAVNNLLSGIFVEISCGAVVEDNYLAGNGFGTRYPSQVNNAAIMVGNSPDVVIRRNELRDNAKSVGAIHWDHPDVHLVDRCDPSVRNLLVTENLVVQEGGVAMGLDAPGAGAEVWSSWGNDFRNNVFEIDRKTYFRWENRSIDLEAWEAVFSR